MRRIGYIQEAPGEIEVAVLKLTTADHDKLHSLHEKFINNEKVFSKPVTSLTLYPDSHQNAVAGAVAKTPEPETWMSVVIHKPACACVGTCTPLKDS